MHDERCEEWQARAWAATVRGSLYVPAGYTPRSRCIMFSAYTSYLLLPNPSYLLLHIPSYLVLHDSLLPTGTGAGTGTGTGTGT